MALPDQYVGEGVLRSYLGTLHLSGFASPAGGQMLSPFPPTAASTE